MKAELLAILSIFKKLESSNHNAASFFFSECPRDQSLEYDKICMYISRTYIRVEEIQRSFLIYGGGRSEATQMIKQEILLQLC